MGVSSDGLEVETDVFSVAFNDFAEIESATVRHSQLFDF